MTIQTNAEIWWPRPPLIAATPAFTSSVIDASGEKVAWMGQVKTPNRGSKDIRKIGFLTGAITSAGGSNIRASLQNVSATAFQPDETQDQTVDFLITAPSANSWYQTEALSADRTVTHGEWLAVVLEFETFAGADAFNVRNHSTSSLDNGLNSFMLKSGSWAQVGTTMNNMVLEFSDGTFGTLGAVSWPTTGFTAVSANTGSDPDELALKFTPNAAFTVEGAWLHQATGAAGRDFEIVLYEGTTALETLVVDAEYLNSTGAALRAFYFATPRTVTAGTAHYLAYKATTASNVSINVATVAAAGHLQALAGGEAYHYATRVDGGAWSATTTTRPMIGLLLSGIHDGAGSGGGLLRHPGMNGGLNA